ncbi:MAG TPA: addiction module protein, partial [Sphaerochaeta sp.]|nr:addiction module protein [Sphaerochaeta sp.]
NLFFYPYTKIEFLQKDLGVSYLTSRKYLEMLANDGLLKKNNYHANELLCE